MMLDQVTDLNQAGMFQLNTILEFPQFVKEAAQTSPADVGELAPERFALPGDRLLPLHTKQDTWLSAAYLHKFGSDLPEHQQVMALSALDKAAGYWNIELPTPEEVNKVEKTASLTYDVTFNVGNVPCICTVSSDEELQKVADSILNSGTYPMSVRQSIAHQVLGAPDEFRTPMAEDTISDLQKVAGMGIGTEDMAISAIRQRLHATQHYYQPIGEGLTELEALVKEASVDGVLSHEMSHKTATMLDAVDRFTGLHHRYNETFLPPEKQLFSVTLHDFDAFTKEAVHMPNGTVVQRSDIEVSMPFLEECFGQKCASLDDAVEFVQSMPERRADMVTDFLQNRGCRIL
jgi:hypothetical protein